MEEEAAADEETDFTEPPLFDADIDLLHLASELIIDAIVEPEDLREELVRRFALASRRRRERTPRRGSVRPI